MKGLNERMPRIKFPISVIEREYNKRYEPEVQKHMLKRIIEVMAARRFCPDDYTKTFMEAINYRLATQQALSDKQADHLADLYNKYSD